MSLLIKDALLNSALQDIYIVEGTIEKIGAQLATPSDETLDAGGMAAIPAFFNGHTHASMAILRGYADDMVLNDWLRQKIWPVEARLTEEEVYWGSRLAILEMIKSGTTFFNDMYWHWSGTARAVEEMGIRGCISAVLIDCVNGEKVREQMKLNEELFEESKKLSSRVLFSLGPHAIYTVSTESLMWCKDFSQSHEIPIHIHLSETEQEVSECIAKHGVRPVEYLEKIGFLSPRVIAAHCVWINDREIELLKEYEVKAVYNPTSNMKLAVGAAMPYGKLKRAGVTIALGTDGCSSNNNLDMLESMKFASLLQKFSTDDCCALPAGEAFLVGTKEGAKAFGLNAGTLECGFLADILLIDHKRAEMVPGYNILSDLVYSANGTCVDTVICGGRVIMRSRQVEGEDEIIAKAKEAANRLMR